MQFSLQSALLSFVVFLTAVTAFGYWGIPGAVGLLAIAIYFRKLRFMSRAARRTWWIIARLYLLGCGIAFSAEGYYYIDRIPALARSLNCLHMIGNALREYEQKNGSFPPAFTADSVKRRALSWRTLLLHYIEEDALFKRYHQTEPWDGPANRMLPAPQEFCWTNHPWSETRMTCLAVVDKNSAWGEGKTWKPRDLPDGGKHTIILIAVADSDVKWCEPRDLTVNEAIVAIQAGPFLRDRGYFYHDRPGVSAVLLGDGRVTSLPAHTRRELLESLLTTSAKTSTLDIDQVIASAGPRPPPALRWDRIGYVSLLVASYSLLLWPGLSKS